MLAGAHILVKELTLIVLATATVYGGSTEGMGGYKSFQIIQLLLRPSTATLQGSKNPATSLGAYSIPDGLLPV